MLTNLISRAADEDRVLFNLIGRPAILAAAFFLGTGSVLLRSDQSYALWKKPPM
jgi:hypothetical protein